jgi:hypothetical protein
MTEPVTHIYVGGSKKVWCGIKLARDAQGHLRFSTPAPITEGEFVDGHHGSRDLCPDCRQRVVAIRGEPA